MLMFIGDGDGVVVSQERLLLVWDVALRRCAKAPPRVTSYTKPDVTNMAYYGL